MRDNAVLCSCLWSIYSLYAAPWNASLCSCLPSFCRLCAAPWNTSSLFLSVAHSSSYSALEYLFLAFALVCWSPASPVHSVWEPNTSIITLMGKYDYILELTGASNFHKWKSHVTLALGREGIYNHVSDGTDPTDFVEFASFLPTPTVASTPTPTPTKGAPAPSTASTPSLQQLQSGNSSRTGLRKVRSPRTSFAVVFPLRSCNSYPESSPPQLVTPGNFCIPTLIIST